MAEEKKKHAGGRPPKEIDYSKVEEMAARGCTQEDIADELNIARSTLNTREEFSDSIKKGKARVRNSLTSRAVEMGLGGDKVMLIFALKNLCGWRDVWDIKQEVSGNVDVTAVLQKLAAPALKAIANDDTGKT